MSETKIELNRWYRHDGFGPVVVVRQCEGRMVWEVRRPGGSECYVSDEYMEPWVPRVGEWVRYVNEPESEGWGPILVTGPADDYKGRPCMTVRFPRFTAPEYIDLVEPCLPPAEVVPAPSEPPSEVRTEPPATTVLARRDDGATCRACGGPAYLGLGLGPPECCAEPCPGPAALPGPTVRARWMSARGTFVDAGHPRAELVYVAEGQRRTTIHPIREEAVRLWREEVRRG